MGRYRVIVAGLASAILAVTAAPALAQPEDVGAGAPMLARGAPVSHQDANTEAGRPVLLFHYIHIDARCGPTAMKIQVIMPPAHGVLAIDDGQERPWSQGRPMFSSGDPRARCANRLAASEDGVYTPAPGFSGHDTLVAAFAEGGVTFTDTIDISVW